MFIKQTIMLFSVPDFLSGGSEFIDNLLQKIWMNLYQGLYWCSEKLFNNMMNVMDTGIANSRETLTQTPRHWNTVAFAFIKGAAENAAIPIAGCIITFVFAWQVISMVQESNQMHNIKPETMLILMLKLGICLLVCSKSFDIVCGLFDLGNYAARHIPAFGLGASGSTSFQDVLASELDDYNFTVVMQMLVNLFLTLIALGLTYALSVAIFIRVNMWYLELLVYASAAPIPFATFMNKEWGQVGTNYLRKMLAMSFEGFFMLVAFGLYTAFVSKVVNSSNAPDQYLMSMITTCACGFGLIMILNKAGNISASIFNAH
ncbi:MAG: CD0415/CD1112 family protein [Lachnospiraceae bacterium]|nr:CD0415/CD1112 family protein [Lachnospiraceae bacterium]